MGLRIGNDNSASGAQDGTGAENSGSALHRPCGPEGSDLGL